MSSSSFACAVARSCLFRTLLLHVHRSKASLYRMLSGASSMHKRGYRDKIGKA